MSDEKRICPKCGAEILAASVDCPRCARITKASRSLWAIPVGGTALAIVPWIFTGPWGAVVWFVAVAIAWGFALRDWARLTHRTPRPSWVYTDDSFLDGD